MSPFVKEQVESLRELFPELTIDVHVIEGDRPKWEYLREMVRLPAIVNNGRYDIIHAHFGLSLISLLLINAPIVVTFHGSDLLLNPSRYISRLLAPRAARVIVVSQKLQSVLGRGEVIPCGINVNRFALPSGYANVHRLKTHNPLNILFPSNPDNKIKDYGLFRATCRKLTEKGYDIREVYLANISRENVPSIYWRCDLMLLTSYSEGSPTVIKEAIAAKLPFVSVDVGDVKEWVRLIDFGTVVADRSPETIAESSIRLISQLLPRPCLDNSKCIDLLDFRTVSQRIFSLYQDLLHVDS